MEIWINIGAKYFLYQCHSVPCHLSWLGLSPCGVHGPRSSLCCYLAVPGGRGMYSNHCNVRGLFIMLFEMKCSKHNLSRLQESKEHCAPIPVPGAVSALEMHTSTGAPGNGASLWGPGTVNFAAGSVGFKSSQAHTRLQTAATYSFEGRRASQCSPAGSGKDGLCPLQHALLRAWQR